MSGIRFNCVVLVHIQHWSEKVGILSTAVTIYIPIYEEYVRKQFQSAAYLLILGQTYIICPKS